MIKTKLRTKLRGLWRRKKTTPTSSIHDRWESESNDPLHVYKPDGTQWLYHPDGRKEQLHSGHPYWDDWAHY